MPICAKSGIELQFIETQCKIKSNCKYYMRKENVMTCLEAQSKITAFINDELDMAALEEFLNHVNHCPECREELEVYYTLLTAMKLLNEDKEVSNQFSQALEHKLKMSADKIKRRKNARIRTRFAVMLLALCFIILSSISVTTNIVRESAPVKPSFEFAYHGVPDRVDPVKHMIRTYDDQAKQYLLALQRLKISLCSRNSLDEFGLDEINKN